ncbi:hypothetical protein HO380_001457, partial [Neisseria gonorrhoeae]
MIQNGASPCPQIQHAGLNHNSGFLNYFLLKHRPEPDIIRPSTSVKIFFFNRSNRYKEPKMNPARKKTFSSLLF